MLPKRIVTLPGVPQASNYRNPYLKKAANAADVTYNPNGGWVELARRSYSMQDILRIAGAGLEFWAKLAAEADANTSDAEIAVISAKTTSTSKGKKKKVTPAEAAIGEALAAPPAPPAPPAQAPVQEIDGIPLETIKKIARFLKQ